jgi:hypothetical protein
MNNVGSWTGPTAPGTRSPTALSCQLRPVAAAGVHRPDLIVVPVPGCNTRSRFHPALGAARAPQDGGEPDASATLRFPHPNRGAGTWKPGRRESRRRSRTTGDGPTRILRPPYDFSCTLTASDYYSVPCGTSSSLADGSHGSRGVVEDLQSEVAAGGAVAGVGWAPTGDHMWGSTLCQAAR